MTKLEGHMTFKRVSLEGGGKAPVLVFADANLDKAMDAVAAANFLYGGQSCTAGSRLLVERSIHDRFVEGILDRARAYGRAGAEILATILTDSEEHVDWLEQQLSLIGQVGLQNYLQSQMGEGEEA